MALYGTMVKIETVTVGSGGAASIEFANIPQTYTDLVVLFSLRSAGNVTSSWSLRMTLNSDTTDGNYSYRYLQGDGSAVYSGSASNRYAGQLNNSTATASTFGNGTIYLPNYAGSTNKSYSSDTVAENNATGAFTNLLAGLRSNTAAITTLKLDDYNGNNLAQYSSATLYGISRTTSQIKATGGMVYDTDTHVYHLFNTSGTFTPTQNLTVDYLVVAGGGGGGSLGGGAGAGGLRSTVTATGGGGSLESALSLTANTGYTVTVGAGGTGGTN